MVDSVETSKIAIYKSTVFYYRQKFINWTYVAPTSYEDIIIIDVDNDYEITRDLSKIIGKVGTSGQTFYFDVQRFVTEDGLKNNYITYEVRIASYLPVPVLVQSVKNELPSPYSYSKNYYYYVRASDSEIYETFNRSYVTLNSVSLADRYTIKFKPNPPYPQHVESRTSVLSTSIPYGTAIDLPEADVKTGTSTLRSLKPLIVQSISMMFTPTRVTSFSINVDGTIIKSTKSASLLYSSNYDLIREPCVQSETFDILFDSTSTRMTTARSLTFVSASYLSN